MVSAWNSHSFFESMFIVMCSWSSSNDVFRIWYHVSLCSSCYRNITYYHCM